MKKGKRRITGAVEEIKEENRTSLLKLGIVLIVVLVLPMAVGFLFGPWMYPDLPPYNTSILVGAVAYWGLFAWGLYLTFSGRENMLAILIGLTAICGLSFYFYAYGSVIVGVYRSVYFFAFLLLVATAGYLGIRTKKIRIRTKKRGDAETN